MNPRGETWIPDPPAEHDLRAWGLDPAWSTSIDVPSHDGGTYRWHVLDSAPADAAATVLCVHGNPTWAYAWATFLRAFGERCRVIAVDQLGMGFSERTGLRRYATRVRDIDDVVAALDIDETLPLVVAAHDWGGAIAMGWAVDGARRPDGLVLCNTGIAVPDGRRAPALIRLAASAPLRDVVCRRTPLFVAGTALLSGRKLSATDRRAFRAPYRRAAARRAIADFVGDVPLRRDGDHPSDQALADVAAQLPTVDVPVLLAWGARDPVFDDDFAADLARRFPYATLHRFPDASHLVMAEADVAAVVDDWLADLLRRPGRPPSDVAACDDVAPAPLWAQLDERRDDDSTAFVDVADGAQLTWAELARRVDSVAAALRRRGLRTGDRVAMLVPPGIDLVAAVYGVWRAGGVTVVADRGLGLRGLGAAVRSTRPAWVIGPRRARRASALLRWAPRAGMIDIAELAAAPPDTSRPPEPGPDDLAAILFTSGATGPAKGVRYLHRQLAAQRDALASTYGITATDRLVAAFAPFALYGPALGVPTALPDCDVTTPGELTAAALDAACVRVGATMAFASPAALANVVATADAQPNWPGLGALRTVFSAGAPVPAETLRAVAAHTPDARLHTPYGMTEALPVADIDLTEIECAHDEVGGVCVGQPVDGAHVRILPLGFDVASPPDALPAGQTGEIVVHAPWVSDGYAGLWAVERAARPTIGGVTWHRSGDVGHLDDTGRLWVEGRAVHVIEATGGPVTPVPVERAVEVGLGRERVAAVGVGPAGVQQLVVVVPGDGDGLASPELAGAIRDLVDHPVAAVLTLRNVPVDIRHNAKIDRSAVARWAEDVLAGGRARTP